MNINELEELAKAATPHVGKVCDYHYEHYLREGHVDFENADLFIASARHFSPRLAMFATSEIRRN